MEKKKEKKKRKISETDWILLSVIPALICAVCFRPSMGIIRMFPIPLFCMLFAAFLPTKRVIRAVLFFVPAVALNLVEIEDAFLTGVAVAALVICFVCAEVAVFFWKKKKTAFLAVGAAVCVFCLVCTSLLVGNPISAAVASDKIGDHTASVYDMEDGFLTEEIEYDCRNRFYSVTMCSSSRPTEKGLLIYKGGKITDGYLPVLKAQYEADALVKVTTAMREAFPDDTYQVFALDIEGFPKKGELLTQKSDGRYDEKISYCIRLSGRTNYEKLKNSALFYQNALIDAGIPFGELVFTGYNTVGARSMFAISVSGFDGIVWNKAEPKLLTRLYGTEYEAKENELLVFMEKYRK